MIENVSTRRFDDMVAPEAGFYCRPNLPTVQLHDTLKFDGDSQQKVASLVLAPDELLSLRARIYSLYPDKRAIVSPTLSRLYLSRRATVIDAGGATAPNWYLFADGVVGIIYDASYQDLTIALFERVSNRLIWCLKWSEFVHMTCPTSNFHVLHSQRDHSQQHVGILYENRDVAQLLHNSLTYLAQQMPHSTCPTSPSRDQPVARARKKGILRSLSVKQRRASKHEKDDALNNKTPVDDCSLPHVEAAEPVAAATPKCSRRSKLMTIGRRRTVEALPTAQKAIDQTTASPQIGRSTTRVSAADVTPEIRRFGRSQTVIETPRSPMIRRLVQRQRIDSDVSHDTIPEDDGDHVDCSDIKTATTSKTMKLLSRASSFIVRHSTERHSVGAVTEKDHTTEEETETKKRDGTRGRFFREHRKRISRSQSLKLPSTETIFDETSPPTPPDTSVSVELTDEKSLYQRAHKLVKSRPGTDSLLLKGSTAHRVIETGLAARQSRERRVWRSALQDGCIESTDLCVTEL